MSRNRNLTIFEKTIVFIIGILLFQSITPSGEEHSYKLTRNLFPWPVITSNPRFEFPWKKCASALKTISQLGAVLATYQPPKRSYRIVQVESAKKTLLDSEKSFSWPVKGAISSPFGRRIHPVTRMQSFHVGIDIKAKPGTPVSTPIGGRVIFRRRCGANGNLVKLRSNSGLVLYFAHLKNFSCKNGQIMKPGSIIGAVGSSGRATGPHLHFVVKKNGKYLNPLNYLAR